MKQRISIFIVCFLLLSFVSCSNNNQDAADVDESVLENDGYKDGLYCAEVKYYNPNTGKRTTYQLNVEVEQSKLVVMHWPNGGRLDDTHFNPERIRDGRCRFTSDKGYEYSVKLFTFGGCDFNEK